jgi:SHAQKYF class myb-like DNA-binding protein
MFAVSHSVIRNFSFNPAKKQNTTTNNTYTLFANPKVANQKPRHRFLISDTKAKNQKETDVLEKKKLKLKLSLINDSTSSNSSICEQNSTNNSEKKLKKHSFKLRRNRDGSYHCGRWQPDEHQRFIEAIFKFGNEWKQVQKYVGTRSSTQARSHAQKIFVKMKRSDLIGFDIDFSKNSIVTLHSLANNLSSEEYFNAVKVLNCVAFERKPQLQKRKKRDDLSNDSFLELANTINSNLKYFLANLVWNYFRLRKSY